MPPEFRDLAPVETELLPIDEVGAGEPVRLDLGDLAGLAGSLSRYGQINPIVIDAGNVLVSGARRLAAARLLGWQYVAVRRYAGLSPRERLELQLEEHHRRMELTATEQALAVARLAAFARAVPDDAADASGADAPHQPRTRGSLRDLTEHTGWSEAQLREAEKVAAILQIYPELCYLPHYKLEAFADGLDLLPAGEKDEWRRRLNVKEHGRRLLQEFEGAVYQARQAKKTPATRAHEAQQRERLAAELKAESEAQEAQWQAEQTAYREALERQRVLSVDPRDVVLPDPTAATVNTSRTARVRRAGLEPPPLPAGLTPEQEAEASVRWLRAHIIGALCAIQDLAEVAPRMVRRTLSDGERQEALNMAQDGIDYLARLTAELKGR